MNRHNFEKMETKIIFPEIEFKQKLFSRTSEKEFR